MYRGSGLGEDGAAALATSLSLPDSALDLLDLRSVVRDRRRESETERKRKKGTEGRGGLLDLWSTLRGGWRTG